MPHTNNFREKRERQHNTHNRKAGIAKFKRNITHRKKRRWDNRIRRQWTEERNQNEKKTMDKRTKVSYVDKDDW